MSLLYRMRRTFADIPMAPPLIACDLADLVAAEFATEMQPGEVVTIEAVEMSSENYRDLPEFIYR